MKTIIAPFFLLLASTAFSQSISIGFNVTQSGRNVTAVYAKQVKLHEFSFGIGYNINRYAHPDNQFNLYKKRLYATNVLEHINLNFGYQHSIFNALKCVKPFLFFDFQAKYAPTRNKFPDRVTVNSEGELIYTKAVATFGPYTWLENNVGIGFTANITDKFYIKQKFGAGIMLILGTDEHLPSKYVKSGISTLLNFSLGMRL